MNGRIKRGVDHELEAAANEILFPELKKITRPAERDVLTDYMLANRLRREVYPSTGIPDAAWRGNFHRAYNPAAPHLNSRDGAPRPANRHASNGWSAEREGEA